MPPSASWNMPSLSAIAPVNAPRRWPNSSDSISSSGIAPQLTAMNGAVARTPSLCSARATSSLPVPDSPVISTLVLTEWILVISSNTFCIARLLPSSWASRTRPASWSRSARLSSTSARFSSARPITALISSTWNGLVR